MCTLIVSFHDLSFMDREGERGIDHQDFLAGKKNRKRNPKNEKVKEGKRESRQRGNRVGFSVMILSFYSCLVWEAPVEGGKKKVGRR